MNNNNNQKIKGENLKVKDNLFFINDSIDNLLERLNNNHYNNRIERNNLILNVIRLRQPISKYELAKITGLSYATIKTISKGFKFCDLIFEKVAEGENSMPVKLLYIKEEENEN